MNYCDSLFSISPELHAAKALVELDTGKELTFRELQSKVKIFAHYLSEQGITSKSTVVIHLFNGIDVVVAHMATLYLGAVSCLIDPLTQPNSLPYYTGETEAELLLTHAPDSRLPEEIVANLNRVQADTIKDVIENGTDELTSAPYDWSEDEVCAIYYTSGTTSKPKGVTLTTKNHFSHLILAEKYWKPGDNTSKHLCFVPFSHGYGSVCVVPIALQAGAPTYILRSFHPGKVVEAIENHGITHMYGVPSHYQQLLRFDMYHDSLKKLEAVFCAAAKLEIQTMEQWKEVTGFHIDEGYGLIETSTGVVFRINDVPRSTGHVGLCPDPELVEIGILDPSGKPLPVGEEGEIAVRGDSVMPGYLKKPEENDRVFVDGWFKTGDKGYITNDKQLFMTGRIKDIINIAGIKISPYEVEAVLNNHDIVAQSVVVAAEDALYGEVVKAFVQLEKGQELSERDLIKFAQEHLISFQVPKKVEFLDAFPTNNMGKIDRKALRAL